jgi:hypothetical protein
VDLTARAPMAGPVDLTAAAAKSTIPAQQPGLSMEIPGPREDTLNLVGRAASARAPSAGTTMADKKEAFHNAAAPASVAAEGFRAVQAEDLAAVEAEAAGAVAGTGNRSYAPGRS